MSVLSRFGIILAVAALTACAHPLPPPPLVDISTLTCSGTIQLENAVPLVLDAKSEKTASGLLDSTARCLADAEGNRSLYRVYQLPKTAKSYVLMVTAGPWADTILAPRIMLLNSEGATLRSMASAEFTFRQNNLSAVLRSHADEAYLVVASDTGNLGNDVLRIDETLNHTTMAAGGVYFQVHTGTEKINKFTYTLAGSFAVVTSPLPTN